MFASLYRPPSPGEDRAAGSAMALVEIAQQFSPRFERHGTACVSMDVAGLERLLGTPAVIAAELRREAAARGVPVHVAVAATRTAAIVLATARPGQTMVPPGEEAARLAPIRLEVLEPFGADLIATFKEWGLKTLGELAALPSADLAARLGAAGLACQAAARGEDRHPLVPDQPAERFDASLDLEWPIDGLEPLSFVLTRLLEPLAIRLERRDRAAAALRVELRLIGSIGAAREHHVRQLELPSPLRDVRTLRTLALLDLESHPPAAAFDRVAVAIEPTPGRVLQHTLFTRAHPTPEQLSTLLARLGALMGQERVGAPATVDSHRPGAFALTPFRTDHGDLRPAGAAPARPPAGREPPLVSALRRCRQPVPARVAVAAGRPVRVVSDRRGFAGGGIVACAGPWRVSGDWWDADSYGRDEWDVALADGSACRIFQDHQSGGWFIDAVVD